MTRSNTQILREEIRRIATEFNEFKAKSARSEKAMTERIRQLTLENDALKLQIAKNSRRFAVHDSEHSPSSTNSTYNAERDKFRESRAKKEQTGSGYDKTDPEDVPKRRGPPRAIRVSPTTTRQKERSCKTYTGAAAAGEDLFSRSLPK